MIYYKFAQKLQLFFAKLWLDQNMELNFRVANQIQGKIDSRFLQFLSIGLSILAGYLSIPLIGAINYQNSSIVLGYFNNTVNYQYIIDENLEQGKQSIMKIHKKSFVL